MMREMRSVWSFFSLFSSSSLCWQMQLWLTCVGILMFLHILLLLYFYHHYHILLLLVVVVSAVVFIYLFLFYFLHLQQSSYIFLT